VELNRLPIVKELRRDPEIWQEWVAYSSFTPEERRASLMSGVLSALEAVPVQRIFVNKNDGRVINVVWLGNSVSGWPRVVHGGVLASILDETMGRAAIFHLPAKTGKERPHPLPPSLSLAIPRVFLSTETVKIYFIFSDGHHPSLGVTATLEIAYRRLALTNQFFIVRADIVREGSSERKAVVHGSVETSTQGAPLTEAKALFVVPRNMELGKIGERF
jgi:acyl-coenzyme A thioesterase PaaI-like protein